MAGERNMTFDEILKWAPDNEDVFKELLRSIEKGSVIPFVGAGMSVPIYPLWGDVLIQLTEKLVSEENKKIITDILNAPSLPDSFTKAADNLIKMRKVLYFHFQERKPFHQLILLFYQGL